MMASAEPGSLSVFILADKITAEFSSQDAIDLGTDYIIATFLRDSFLLLEIFLGLAFLGCEVFYLVFYSFLVILFGFAFLISFNYDK